MKQHRLTKTLEEIERVDEMAKTLEFKIAELHDDEMARVHGKSSARYAVLAIAFAILAALAFGFTP